MISSRKLTRMARKWMKVAGILQKRIAFQSKTAGLNAGSPVAIATTKGHFVVYTSDGRRFELPLKWLADGVFVEILKMAEEEFGLPGDGPITLPFDGSFMEEVVALMQKHALKRLKEALLLSMAMGQGSSSSSTSTSSMVLPWPTGVQQQLLVC